MEPVARSLRSWGLPPREAKVWVIRSSQNLEELPSDPWIPRGFGRSYGDQALAPRVGDLTAMSFFLEWDRRGVLRAEAGVTFRDLIDTFLPRGFFPPVTPGTQAVSLGGAVASNVHGKNHHQDGDFARWIRHLRVWFPSQGIQNISPSDPRFPVVVGSLGLVGVITEVEVKLLPVPTAWIRSRRIRANNLDHLVQIMVEEDVRYRYAVAWVDGFARGKEFGRGVVFLGDHARKDEIPPYRDPWHLPRGKARRIPWVPSKGMLSPALMRVYAAWYYDVHPTKEEVVDVRSFFYPLDGIANWNRFYGQRGLVQIQVVVREKNLSPIVEELLTSGPVPPYLVVLKRMGKGQGVLGFGLEGGWTVAADYPRVEGMREFALRVYEKTAEVGGKVYLTKDAFLTPSLLRAMYPVDDFLSWKSRLDPEGVLCSDFARRVGLC